MSIFTRVWQEGDGRRTRPATVHLFVLSFAALIGVGTLGFLVLPGLYTGPRLGLVDALFTATSAVCVTGLIVVDTSTYFTPFGQAWIAALIQAGGLGILTLTTLVALSLGRRSLALEGAYAGGDPPPLRELDEGRLVRVIVLVTLAIEAVGAVLLWAGWARPLGAVGALWPAVFHAISAFCNAGFSVFGDSLVGFRTSAWTLYVVSLLIVLGGLGFVVLEDLRLRVRHRRRRLTLHSRLVLSTTVLLLVGGTVLFLFFEWGNDLSGLGLADRVANAFMMAVTPRTAGFNTVDYGATGNASLFLTILLMVVGGSPGSTAGGLKTTTLALLVLVLVARLRGDDEVHAFRRTIPRDTIQRAVGLMAGGLAVVAVGVFVLLITETSGLEAADRQSFLELVFEAHSAFGTVGLSMGITPALSPAGRIVVTILMFVGRVGPMALVASMAGARRRPRVRFRYSQEDVTVG